MCLSGYIMHPKRSFLLVNLCDFSRKNKILMDQLKIYGHKDRKQY